MKPRQMVQHNYTGLYGRLMSELTSEKMLFSLIAGISDIRDHLPRLNSKDINLKYQKMIKN